MIHYDLNDVDPVIRVTVLRQVQSRGIPNTVDANVLSVPDEFEAIIDHLISSAERQGDSYQTFETTVREIDAGARTMPCDRCGAEPAAPLRLRRQVGMVVVMKTETLEGVFCLPCGLQFKKWVQKQNALKGWTGVKSAVMNPVVLSSNEKEYRTFLQTIEGAR